MFVKMVLIQLKKEEKLFVNLVTLIVLLVSAQLLKIVQPVKIQKLKILKTKKIIMVHVYVKIKENS